VLAPTTPRRCYYGGFAAAVRGDAALARTRWEALKSLHPPPQIVAMLDARIADLGPIGTPDGAPATAVAPALDESVFGRDGHVGEGSSAAEVTVNISIGSCPEVTTGIGGPFVRFAREPGSQGAPLAPSA